MGDPVSVLILGLGTSGLAAARYCLDRFPHEYSSVTVVDGADTAALRASAGSLAEEGAQVLLGVEEVPGSYDICIASPGIAPHTRLFQSARDSSREFMSEIEFAYRQSSCRWVAITGTNGKTTTTALTAHLLTSAGIRARAVGNIGTPAIGAVGEGWCDDEAVLVAEVSSFQLASTSEFHARVAVLLNVTPDHIDWHGSFENYAADKARVFGNMGEGDVAVIDVDDAGAAGYAATVEGQGTRVVRVSLENASPGGATVQDGNLTVPAPSLPETVGAVSDLRIIGAHNVSNALAAASAAAALGVPASELAKGLRSFEPIEHRLEPAGSAAGAEWFNDSKATNPDAVSKAIAAFGDRPLVLLLGGRNKGNDFGPLALEASRQARAVVLFGEAAEELAGAFATTGIRFSVVPDLSAAVEEASRLAEPGDAVVLSPACASFDEFSGYAERGRVFKEQVSRIAERERTA